MPNLIESKRESCIAMPSTIDLELRRTYYILFSNSKSAPSIEISYIPKQGDPLRKVKEDYPRMRECETLERILRIDLQYFMNGSHNEGIETDQEASKKSVDSANKQNQVVIEIARRKTQKSKELPTEQYCNHHREQEMEDWDYVEGKVTDYN
ncbi:hypothetical protein N7540_000447 [Penicillium herquei]|nr:hypothetical protein N7540_000447 [Penicillium herquei]